MIIFDITRRKQNNIDIFFISIPVLLKMAGITSHDDYLSLPTL